MAESTEIAIPAIPPAQWRQDLNSRMRALLEAQWRQDLNYKMRALLEAPPFEPEPEPNSDNRHQTAFRIDEDYVSDNEHYYLMDANLYNSAKQGGGHAFLDALEQVSELNKVRINRLLKTVSLSGDTLLHVAARDGNADVVDLIINHFPSLLNEVNLIGDTAVHVAVKADQVSVLRVINSKRKEFLNSGSLIFCGLTNTQVKWKDDSLKVKNKQGNTPLHEALIKRHENVAVIKRYENMAVELLEEDVSVSVFQNIEGESAFYLAAEAGYFDCLELMMKYVEHEGIDLRDVGKSPIHAAIMGKSIVVLWIMLDTQPGLINLRDDKKRTPLHFAALNGYDYVVNYLITWNNRNIMKRDEDGQLPIHLASMNGRIDVIKELLKHYNSQGLVNGKGQNILHIAAEWGKYDVVNYILKHPQILNQLINQKDYDGNTPLHLAAMKYHPKIISALTWGDTVDLHSTNNDNLTALDGATASILKIHKLPTFRQRLTLSSLRASGASRGKNTNKRQPPPPPPEKREERKLALRDFFKDFTGALLVVSTLIAIVTFAAGFNMPGGYNNSEPDVGIATMIKHSMFQLFVVFDTIAMFTSLTLVVLLILGQSSDLRLKDTILNLAVPLLGIALTTMSLAFITGVYLTLSTLKGLANEILIIALILLIVPLLLFLVLAFPFASRFRVFRYIAFYYICVVNRLL